MKKILSLVLALVMLIPCININAYADAVTTLDAKYERKMKLVSELLMKDEKTLKKVEELGRAVVYISVSNGRQQAVTVSSSMKNIDNALDATFEKARKTDISPLWFKLDVVTEVEEISYADFTEKYKEGVGGSLRQGISFNNYFGRSLLEAQINSNGILSYETGKLDLKKINSIFSASGKKLLSSIPETLYLFKAQGYFSDTVSDAYKLYSGRYAEYGTRKHDIDRYAMVELAENASKYLAKMCGPDGKFVYGYYPIDNEELEGYNIIRHAGTVWNLILQYDMTGDRTLIPAIERALKYLEKNIHYKDERTAFLNDRGTLNVGGNGISLLAYVSYAEIMNSRKFDKLIAALCNGIMYLQKEDGSFIHTIYKSDYSVHKEYITVFYDGEATYGLLRAYGLLGNPKYLTAGEKACDYFIANNYETLNSHWIAYSFNEVTKFSPKAEYFNFGLKNVHGYTDKVNRTVTAAHTTCETMGATFELYDRLLKSGIECEMLEEFDGNLLIEAFEKRVKYGFNYFVQPEQAMYFKNPQLVLNSFVVREDNYRIRIDDIQHFMGGYYLYYKNYKTVKSYTENQQ
ncbi:MAG: hypothetical protein IJX15_04085 [Ruminiclostridium sp.]|nr:hypothetical protein [Ruminiclostridium sp.]